MIRLATWNVNSIKARLPIVRDWLTAQQLDVLVLQEIKTPEFPSFEFDALAIAEAGSGLAFAEIQGAAAAGAGGEFHGELLAVFGEDRGFDDAAFEDDGLRGGGIDDGGRRGLGAGSTGQVVDAGSDVGLAHRLTDPVFEHVDRTRGSRITVEHQQARYTELAQCAEAFAFARPSNQRHISSCHVHGGQATSALFHADFVLVNRGRGDPAIEAELSRGRRALPRAGTASDANEGRAAQ